MPAPALVLLAAGASRRYGRPKQLDPLGPGGETIMELTSRDAVAAGIGRIVLVVSGEAGAGRTGVGSMGAAVTNRMREAARRDGYADAVPIESVEQRLEDVPPGFSLPGDRARPWGTAHALRAARHALAESGAPIVVANADDWYGPDAVARIVRSAAESGDPRFAALVPYPLQVTLPPASAPEAGGVSRGIVRTDEAGRLVDLREVLQLRREPGSPGVARGRAAVGCEVHVPLGALCSMNLWGFGPAIWDALEHHLEEFLAHLGSDREAEWFLPDVVLAAAADGYLSVHALEPGTVHLGITHPADRERVREGLRTALPAG